MSGERARIVVEAERRVGSLHLQVDFRPTGRVAAVVGPSGAGKSTLLRILAGLDRASTGRVEVDAEVWLDTSTGVWRPPWERGVGWVPQDALLFPHLGVRENLAYGGASPAQVDEAAEPFEVAHLLERRPRNLSGGERQRVALVRALLATPRLLLLDEPFSALDPELRASLARRLAGWAEARSLPVVLVSHDATDAELLGAERWQLRGGRLDPL